MTVANYKRVAKVCDKLYVEISTYVPTLLYTLSHIFLLTI